MLYSNGRVRASQVGVATLNLALPAPLPDVIAGKSKDQQIKSHQK